ncbi:MAG: hypothetical protein NZ927_08235 [Candidatus Calescibacterium sp.]|nr:hypothetical protein [Candidatus Calescibacterium sp.]
MKIREKIVFIVVFSLIISCGRAWRGEKFREGEILIIPSTAEIFSAPEMDIEIRQWDFTLDNSDIPHVSFYDSFQGALSYSTLDINGKWSNESVDPIDKGKGVLAGSSPNIFFVNENLHIVYLATSIRDKVPKFYIIKEAVKDPLLGVWRCRIVKIWNSPISVIRAGYMKDINKIAVIFLDQESKKLIFGAFSPAKNNELEICKTPETEENEIENSDIKYTSIYHFGQESLRLNYEIDKSCNTVSARVGYSAEIIPTFTRNRESLFGVSLYDPSINQTFWIEIKQNSILGWLNNQKDEIETKRDDRGEISFAQVGYKIRNPENLCVTVDSIMYKFELSKPADSIAGVFYKRSDGKWIGTKFFQASPDTFYTYPFTDPAYPVEVTISYKPSFLIDEYSIGSGRTNLSVSADKDGNIHIADFIFIPPLMAVEYGFLTIDESGKFASRFEVLDGGGGGLFSQGTGGVAVSVRTDGIPIVAYFSPFTADLKVAIPVRETWISVPKLTGPISGINPKMLLTRAQNIAVMLSPVIYGDRRVLTMIFIPLTL